MFEEIIDCNFNTEHMSSLPNRCRKQPVNIDDAQNQGIPRGPGNSEHDVCRFPRERETGKFPDRPVLPVIPVAPVTPSSPVAPLRPGGPGDPVGPVFPVAQTR